MHYAVYIVALVTKLALAIPQVDSSQLSGLPPCAVSSSRDDFALTFDLTVR